MASLVAATTAASTSTLPYTYADIRRAARPGGSGPSLCLSTRSTADKPGSWVCAGFVPDWSGSDVWGRGDSNPHWHGPKPCASANWATAPGTPRESLSTATPRGAGAALEEHSRERPALSRRDRVPTAPAQRAPSP